MRHRLKNTWTDLDTGFGLVIGGRSHEGMSACISEKPLFLLPRGLLSFFESVVWGSVVVGICLFEPDPVRLWSGVGCEIFWNVLVTFDTSILYSLRASWWLPFGYTRAQRKFVHLCGKRVY